MESKKVYFKDIAICESFSLEKDHIMFGKKYVYIKINDTNGYRMADLEIIQISENDEIFQSSKNINDFNEHGLLKRKKPNATKKRCN